MANTTNKETKKPIERFQLRSITASVFENKSEKGATFYKVSLSRTYKDGDDFKNTHVFSRDDLPIVEILTKKAWVSILKREQEAASERSE